MVLWCRKEKGLVASYCGVSEVVCKYEIAEQIEK